MPSERRIIAHLNQWKWTTRYACPACACIGEGDKHDDSRVVRPQFVHLAGWLDLVAERAQTGALCELNPYGLSSNHSDWHRSAARISEN
jgi:hypothetical protein